MSEGRRTWTTLALQAAGRKHARATHECFLCGKRCRGNGGITSHERACYRRNGLEWAGAEDQKHMSRFALEGYRAAEGALHAALVAAGRRGA